MAPQQAPQLSSKEQSLFRTVVRNYEDKQYKKGIKAADQILRKNPKHGDTLAMKALIMNSQGKTDEAFALAKVALQCDMKSHVCWHVYGLLYRAVKNFEEAIKAYKFALRLEPESSQIQRDLALLQVQMRDYQGYLASRKAMLQNRSTIRQSWTALAVAHHLNGDLVEAERVLTAYEETLKNPPSKTDFENSEAVMYKISLIAEQGEFEKALELLESAGKHSLDRLAFLELRATYLLKLGRKDDAAKAYRALIDRNSEYKTYYDGLIEALGVAPTDHKALKAVYDEYAEKYPRCDAARRLPLDFLEGDDFREAADSYIRRMLDKGVPSTFANLKHLYSNPSKKELLPELVLKYIESSGNEREAPKGHGDTSKGASAAYYFLAQHYNYYLSRNLDKALEFIEKALELEPESVDFTMTKARIWKHYGNVQKASEIMEQARNLDGRDRYINTKAAKYQLRNNEHDAAIKTVGLFTRAETVGGPLADLHDMQCMWFLTEDGQAYAREGKIGLALKRFTSIYNIFDVWQEDQFDFHSFSLRKGQMRAYVDMIRWEDQLREHPFFSRASLSAIDVYLKIHDKPLSNGINGDANGDDAAERKKAAKKARKEAQKAEREAAAKKIEPNKSTPVTEAETKKKDDDPNGEKLAASTEPLVDALKFLTPLLQFSPKNIDGQLAGFEVYIRRKKYLLALRCLLASSALNKDHPTVHEQLIRFKLAIDTDLESVPSKSAEVIKSESTLLPASTDLSKYNDEYLSQHKDSPRHVISAQKVRKLLSPDSASKNEKDIASILSLADITLEDATVASEVLASWRSSELEGFKSAAAAKWANSSVFSSPT